MADVHNHNPTAADIAKVVIAEAMKSLGESLSGRTPAECLSMAFATSLKDPRPFVLDDRVLVVLLAQAVARQAAEIDELKKGLAAVKRHAGDLDSRTLGSVVVGPAANNHRQAVADAKRDKALVELKAKLEADPNWVAAREKLNADLAARRVAREGKTPEPPATESEPPHPTGGMGE